MTFANSYAVTSVSPGLISTNATTKLTGHFGIRSRTPLRNRLTTHSLTSREQTDVIENSLDLPSNPPSNVANVTHYFLLMQLCRHTGPKHTKQYTPFALWWLQISVPCASRRLLILEARNYIFNGFALRNIQMRKSRGLSTYTDTLIKPLIKFLCMRFYPETTVCFNRACCPGVYDWF